MSADRTNRAALTDSRRLNGEFVDKYRDALHSAANTIEKRDPDYIISLTRRAPRILELMIKAGIWSGNTTVLSEKSLDFIPDDQLQDKDIILFDDIVISGSTIEKIRSRLAEYGTITYILTLAVDINTIALDKGEIDYQIELDRSKRYEFAQDVVQALIHLNKPYDVDHAIFYSYIGERFIDEFRSQRPSYDLTTLNQDRNGYERYSYMLSESQGVTERVLTAESVDIQIEKIRAYYDTSSQQGALVPTVVYSIHKEQVDTEIFIEELGCLNDLLEEVCNFLNSNNEEMALYRYIFYLVSYLQGLSFCMDHSRGEWSFLEYSSPRAILDFQDLCYLFGPSVAEITLSSLESHSGEIIGAIERLKLNDENTPHDPTSQLISGSDERLSFDDDQKQLYGNISQYLEDHITGKANYSRALSTVFEAIYTQIEIEKQESLRERSMSQSESETREMLLNEHDRLEAGFNFSQLKTLLEVHGAPTNDIGLSLAMDYLIDKGVPIPRFNERRVKIGDDSETGSGNEFTIIERVYRHGENCFDNKTYEYIINATVRELFKYAEENGTESFNQIPFEKMGVFFEDKLTNPIYWENPSIGRFDALRTDPLESHGANKTLEVGATYHRHGKVLNISEQATANSANLFVDWCNETGVTDLVEISENQKEVRRSDQWESNNENMTEETTSIPGQEISSFSNLARLLFEVENYVDPSTGDYLTAITSCRDKEDYLHSIRKELQLFFENDKYNLSSKLEQTATIHREFEYLFERALVDPQSDDFDQLKKRLKSNLKALNNGPVSAVHGVQHKTKLWRSLDDIILEVDDYFESHENSAVTGMYNENLKPYLENISSRRYPEGLGDPLQDLIQLLSQFCIKLSNVLQALLECCIEIIDGSDKAPAHANKLTSAIDSWNSMARNEKRVTSIYLKDLPSIEIEETEIDYLRTMEVRDEFEDKRTALKIIEILVPQIQEANSTLYRPYAANLGSTWEEEMSDIFPDDEEWEELPHRWVVWFDIKDSSGAVNSDNAKRARKMINQLETKLSTLRGLSDDGVWQTNRDDQCHIFIDDQDNVPMFLNGVLDLASNFNIYLRTSVSKIETGELRQHRYDKSLDTEKGHTRAVRIGDAPEKDYSCHTLAVEETVEDALGEGAFPSAMSSNWVRQDELETITEDLRLKGKGTTTIFISKIARS